MVQAVVIEYFHIFSCWIVGASLGFHSLSPSAGPERRSADIDKKNKEITAYHESGHAIIAYYTKDAMPINKATIMPRGPTLGHVSTFELIIRTSTLKGLIYLVWVEIVKSGLEYFRDVSCMFIFQVRDSQLYSASVFVLLSFRCPCSQRMTAGVKLVLNFWPR